MVYEIPNIFENLISTGQAAKQLEISERELEAVLKRLKIHTLRIGSQRLLDRREYELLLERENKKQLEMKSRKSASAKKRADRVKNALTLLDKMENSADSPTTSSE